MSTIITFQTAGGVVQEFEDALQDHPTRGFAIYNRCSSWGSAGKWKYKLREKTEAVQCEARRVAEIIECGSMKRMPFQGVEFGQLSKKRPKLREAFEYARSNGLILVARDLSRFIRSDSYDRRTNRNAQPSKREFARLSELADGVPLATLIDPLSSEDERHALVTKAARKNGRPSSFVYPITLCVLEALGSKDFDNRWEKSLSVVAKQFGVTKAQIVRLLNRVNPHDPPHKWNYYESPAVEYRRARKMEMLGSKPPLFR